MTAKEFLKTNGCEHDGSYVPITEVERLMEAYANQAIAERMPTKVDVIKLLKGYSWEYQEIFKDGCDWFRSRMEEKK